MSTRRQAREIAFQILYRYDQVQAAALASGASAPPIVREPTALLKELQEHFNHFRVPAELREFAALLASGALTRAVELDGLLEKHAANWKISRMSMIDRNLLRMAIFELLHMPETPPTVVIDEAIELAKQFGTTDSPAFDRCRRV